MSDRKQRFLNTVGEELEVQDANYCQLYSSETVAWSRLGVYQMVAEVLDLQSGDLHLDAGCGHGKLLGELKKKTPDSVAMGVERNLSMLLTARDVIHRQGLSSNLYSHSRLNLLPQSSLVQTEFRVDSRALEAMNIFQRGGPIQLIHDDLRTHEIISHVLAGRMLDSGSFTFPGMSLRLANEAPYKVGSHDASEMDRRRIVAVNETRKSTMDLMACSIKAGGVLVLAERMRVPPSIQNIDQLFNAALQESGGATPYWEFDQETRHAFVANGRFESVMDASEMGRVEWVFNDKEGSLKKTVEDKVVVVTMRLIRTKVPVKT